MASHSPPSAIVVGAGVFGVTGALELARRGWRVTLLEGGGVPCSDAASTDVSKVVRMDYGSDAFLTELAREALDGWRRWNEAGPRRLFHETGFLLLAREPMDARSFEGASLKELWRRKVPLDRLGADELTERFPALGSGVYEDGYFNPWAGWAESGALVAWLARRARKARVVIREGVAVSRLLEGAGRVRGVQPEDGGPILADHVVVAAGVRTPLLVPELHATLWATGQPVFHLTPADPEPFRAPALPVWAADISGTGWYGFPALADGTVKVANHGVGRRVDPGADPPEELAVEPIWIERLRDFLGSSLPGLARARVASTRLCLYCDSFDSDFLIARHPERQGLTVASGGSGHGFKFAPLLGDLIADAVEGRDGPERFRWREPGSRRTEAARSDSV